ncbi:Predicted dehydrogenase [Catalinimonas alkaloidigena]|uniref:Predicted dehydrogenase n=1 Tax=Catalinimonas alkaloidigena TaxID=1075417 RepID=A0A1G9RLD8_9BACT|nr:Gfo/Idh/MocA family oxidoreductase [Catalinimonas alkaloidigena]SDM23870.1 Predicted dehydrogenase [Catalinimonas alkaloidigena]
MNRRHFLTTTAAASLAYSALPLYPALSRASPYRTALIGSGWWGMNILRTAMAAGASKVVAMCDVDQHQLQPAADEVRKLSNDRPKLYRDYRELLAKEKLEIVIVATPDHWHPLIAIAAADAGAHVYVEKPISHTLREGRAMVNAARRNGIQMQVGTHRRASPHNQSAMEFLRSGKVGKIGMVRAFVHYGGGPGEVTPDEEPPAGLDWDFWCGPAPLRAFNPRIHPKGFRMFLDYANGQLGDWGIHWLDQILWWTEEKYPKRISSVGGRFIKEDTTTAPDTQSVQYEFEDFVVEWEHRLYAANQAEKHNIGCYFYGTEGTLHLGWIDGWTFYPADKNRQIVHQEPKLHEPDQQNIPELWADFLASITRKRPPMCDIEIGHRSTSMSLLGMLSYKLGRGIAWDGEKEEIPNDVEANHLLSRPYRGPWEYPTV